MCAFVADSRSVNKQARLWGKHAIERESKVLGDADPSCVLPADFVVPLEMNAQQPLPPTMRIEMTRLDLFATAESVPATPLTDLTYDETPFSDMSRLPPIHNYTASASFIVSDMDSGDEHMHTFSLDNDIYFVTAHPCVPSQHVKIFKSPSSPTIQHVDISGGSGVGKTANLVGMLEIVLKLEERANASQVIRCISTLLIRRFTCPSCLRGRSLLLRHFCAITPNRATDPVRRLLLLWSIPHEYL